MMTSYNLLNKLDVHQLVQEASIVNYLISQWGLRASSVENGLGPVLIRKFLTVMCCCISQVVEWLRPLFPRE
ncbi:hypothetical protein RJ641_020563, partial [Dillenia turbinata]